MKQILLFLEWEITTTTTTTTTTQQQQQTFEYESYKV